MDVMILLQAKNRCLKRFLDVSQDFFTEVQKGSLDRLDSFQEKREVILKTLGLFDKRLFNVLSDFPETFLSDSLRASMNQAIQIGDETLERIRAIDAQILHAIREEAERIQNEIHSARKNKATLSKFKSRWVNESGTEMDHQL